MSNIRLNIIHLNKVDSTNNYAKALLKNGEPLCPFSVIYADEQTAGKGRMGRIWQSTRSNTLCMSLIVPYVHRPEITLLSAIGVHRALSSLTGKDLQIKWPNDIIFDNKKLCGILTEGTPEATVVGIGINLNDTEFPADISSKATSLRLITDSTFSPEDILCAVAEEVFSVILGADCLMNNNLLDEYNSVCANIGRSVSFGTNQRGTATGIDQSGALVVKTANGEEKISFGEVCVSGIY